MVDCDVHQGDGTADLLGPDPDVFTLSLHGARNYPFQRIPSDLDVDLETGTGDDGYLTALDAALDHAIGRAEADVAFYLAGADPWEGDRLGRLALTKRGLLARDELVLDRLRATGAAVCVVLAGGYADDVRDTVDINAATAAAVAGRLSRSRPGGVVLTGTHRLCKPKLGVRFPPPPSAYGRPQFPARGHRGARRRCDVGRVRRAEQPARPDGAEALRGAAYRPGGC